FLTCLLAFSVYGSSHDSSSDIQNCCGSPGVSPGWKNSIQQLPSVNVVTKQKVLTDSDCCAACVQNPNCIGWAFTQNTCYLDVDKEPSPGICDNSAAEGTSSYHASGIIRCSNGCNLRRLHLW
ncbi:26189_t:CDS:1, partial [Dentiscutata erythropus]